MSDIQMFYLLAETIEDLYRENGEEMFTLDAEEDEMELFE